MKYRYFILIIVLIWSLISMSNTSAETIQECLFESSSQINRLGGLLLGGNFITDTQIWFNTDYVLISDTTRIDQILSRDDLRISWAYVMTDIDVRPIVFYGFQKNNKIMTFIEILGDPKTPNVWNPLTRTWSTSCFLDISENVPT